jgi:hypothetical protein
LALASWSGAWLAPGVLDGAGEPWSMLGIGVGPLEGAAEAGAPDGAG